MNSKDKNGKTPVAKKVMPLMTPRNLVPATPMRFSGGSTEQTTTTAAPAGRVIKGPQKSGKDKSSIPLPPGYVDRAAQRRSGQETSTTLNIFETETTTATAVNLCDPMKNKLEFLEETAGLGSFPACSQIQTERLMKLVLIENEAINEAGNKRHVTEFKDNEAFLQFKSIEESKTQPFDAFNRPRKVFRASSASFKDKILESEDDFVLERVKEAVKRLEIANERHQKYLETLNSKKVEVVCDDIFPEVGVFDEKAVLENVINNSNNKTSDKAKAKNRLFASKSSATKPVEKEFDVFELIAQKSLDEEKLVEEATGGGLFGFSSILPKLSRLESENNSTENKLTGVYASILSDDEGKEENNSIRKSKDNPNPNPDPEDDDEEDDYLYPGYLDPTIFDSDEEAAETHEKMPKNKRKLARKEDKEAAKVEKLVKNKFGVDLSK